jgi:hypothetical protein
MTEAHDPFLRDFYRRAFAAMVPERPDALIVSDHGEGIVHRRLIVELAAQVRLPAMSAAGGRDHRMTSGPAEGPGHP